MNFKLIFYHLVPYIFLVSGTYANCTDFKGERPKFKVHSSGFVQFIPQESLDNITAAVDFQQQSLDCSHNSPIELIVNIDPINNPFEIRRNFFSRNLTAITSDNFNQSISTKGNNRRNLVSFTYTIYYSILYKPKVFKTRVLFICQPIGLPNECSQTFLEITPAKYSATFMPTDKPSSKEFQDLSTILLTKQEQPGLKLTNDSECLMTLLIKTTLRNQLEYKWIGNKIVTERVITTNQIVYLNGLFWNVKQEKNCVKFLETNESCKDCKIIGADIINSIAFYAKSESTELVFKGFFNLSSEPDRPRRFYMNWEVPLPEMIILEAPKVAYVNRSVKINCSVSVFYFGFGTILTIDGPPTDTDVPSDEKEVYMLNGRREVSKNFEFSEGNSYVNVSCSAPLLNSTKRISKFEIVFVDYPEPPRINGSSEDILEEVMGEKDELNRVISCSGTGKPLPTLEWKLPDQNIKDRLVFKEHENPNFIQMDLTIPILNKDFIGTYKCVLSNYLGTVSMAFNIQIPIEGLSKGSKAGIGSGAGVVILGFITVILLIYRKIIVQRQEYRTKTAAAIQEFKDGISRKNNDANADHHCSILERPYNDDFEQPFEKWIIEDKFLGQGAFGIVKKGSVEIGYSVCVVAIKMLKSSVEIEDFKSFLTELKIMAYIGHHTNIVSLVAACSQNIDQRDVMIGVEFCHNGSLLEYLVDKKGMFQAFNLNQENVSAELTAQSTETADSAENCLTELDLYTWSFEVANGMEFLATKKVLHGDLATRNVLLTSKKTAKISDFGLSRVLLDSSNYSKKSKVPLPWKWLAIESLQSMSFSTASDVWSYGVTVWEMFSLGEAPYAGLHFSRDFIIQLEEGMRLGKPARATDHAYNLMTNCWIDKPEQRLTFTQLKTAFSEILVLFQNHLSSQSHPSSRATIVPVALPRNLQIRNLNELYSNIPRSSNIYE